jgi:hypothetical protein
MSTKECIRVGNAGGYWGDDPTALLRQISGGQLDYVTQDFLAEITMSILQKQRSRNSELGYATDFVNQFRDVLPILEESGTKIISNAGGINPLACGQRLEETASETGRALNIAVVVGDDLLGQLDTLLASGLSLRNMETGQHLIEIRDRVLSANAYLGSGPVIKALEEEAQVVVTGRVTDTAIAAAPPAFEFGWSPDDLDQLASAVVAGHILECGAHSTGGNMIDWESVPSFQNMGYPIVEFFRDGSFLVTKHPGTGGVVNLESVISQLVYEMGDPHCYLTPDVTADFTSFEVEDLGKNRVRISQAGGSPPPETLKVSISYKDGFKAHGYLVVSSPRPVSKAHKIAETLWNRLGIDFEERNAELVGYNSCHQQILSSTEPPEVLLRLSVRDHSREKVVEFAKNLTSLILNTVSGVAIVGARPRVQEVIAYWPCLVPADVVQPEVIVLGREKALPVPPREAGLSGTRGQTRDSQPFHEWTPTQSYSAETAVPLRHFCYARSGDKGDTCNIGLVARSDQGYLWLLENITADRVKDFFSEICKGEVERYEVPNLKALNFLLHNALGGGGTASLRVDPQGKTLAEAILNMEVVVPEELTEPEKD